MPTSTYRNLLLRARAELTPAEQRQLASELTAAQQEPPQERSLLELEGLGKEIWEGIDVDKYIDEERAAWD